MKKNNMRYYTIRYLVPLFLLLFITSCNSVDSSDNDDEQNIENEVFNEIDSASAQVYKFNNTLFSIPSPYEVSILMKNAGIEFNPNIVNPSGNAQTYTDNFKKSINLGVYGADLAYLNMNNQIPQSGKYFATVKIIAEELQISGAFEVETIRRIESNMGNEDSLLYILSKAYRNSDKYLKENNREDIGALVLAGGWIESLYFLSEVAQETQNKEIINRLGEQKYPLENLIKILTPFYNISTEYADLLESLIDLAYVFDGIDVEYIYEKPSTDEEKKITSINSSSHLLMNPEHVEMISEKIVRIRNNITD